MGCGIRRLLPRSEDKPNVPGQCPIGNRRTPTSARFVRVSPPPASPSTRSRPRSVGSEESGPIDERTAKLQPEPVRVAAIRDPRRLPRALSGHRRPGRSPVHPAGRAAGARANAIGSSTRARVGCVAPRLGGTGSNARSRDGAGVERWVSSHPVVSSGDDRKSTRFNISAVILIHLMDSCEPCPNCGHTWCDVHGYPFPCGYCKDCGNCSNEEPYSCQCNADRVQPGDDYYYSRADEDY